jgi:hypothetical protein
MEDIKLTLPDGFEFSIGKEGADKLRREQLRRATGNMQDLLFNRETELIKIRDEIVDMSLRMGHGIEEAYRHLGYCGPNYLYIKKVLRINKEIRETQQEIDELTRELEK